MRYAFMLSTALLMAFGQSQPAPAQSPADLVKQGVEALGGANALRALKTMVLKIDAKHWEPGQSHSVNGESRFLGDSMVTVSVDYTDPIRVRYQAALPPEQPAVYRVPVQRSSSNSGPTNRSSPTFPPSGRAKSCGCSSCRSRAAGPT